MRPDGILNFVVGYSFLGPKRSVVGGLHAAGDNNNKGSLLCNFMSSPQSHPKQTKRNALVRRSADP